eukprot:gene8555-2886_t
MAVNARKTWWTSTKISSRRNKNSQHEEKETEMARADAVLDAKTDTSAETDGSRSRPWSPGRGYGRNNY